MLVKVLIFCTLINFSLQYNGYGIPGCPDGFRAYEKQCQAQCNHCDNCGPQFESTGRCNAVRDGSGSLVYHQNGVSETHICRCVERSTLSQIVNPWSIG